MYDTTRPIDTSPIPCTDNMCCLFFSFFFPPRSELSNGQHLSLFSQMSQAVSTSANTQHMVQYIDPTSSNDQLHLLLLASPFLFYTVLWFVPSLWVSVIGSAQPSDTMAQVAHVLKLVQGYVLYSLCKDHYLMPGQWIEELGQTTVICSVFLLVLGQYLNVSVYNALGTNGVYYGVRFGIDVPWCDDFPYNVSWLKHPQYVGSIMSVIAAIPLIQLPLTWYVLVRCGVPMVCPRFAHGLPMVCPRFATGLSVRLIF